MWLSTALMEPLKKQDSSSHRAFTLESMDGVVRQLPVDKILVETDSPYCLIRRSYAGSRYSDLIKSRFNEPAFIRQIVEIVAKIKEMEIDELEEILYENTLTAFPKLKKFKKYWP